ncbi:MAG: hypothetical protein AB7I19_11080 [Planctomycetota bacterium]
MDRSSFEQYLRDILDVIRTECPADAYVDAIRNVQARAPVSTLGILSDSELAETYAVTTFALAKQFLYWASEHRIVERSNARAREQLAADPQRLRASLRHNHQLAAAFSGFFAILPKVPEAIADGTIRIDIDRPRNATSLERWDPQHLHQATAQSFHDYPKKALMSFWWQSGPWRISMKLSDSVWPKEVLDSIRNPSDR